MAYFSTAASCDVSKSLVYPWKDGDPIPSDEDLEDHAEKMWKRKDCHFQILDHSEINWSEVEREFEIGRTLAGTRRLK